MLMELKLFIISIFSFACTSLYAQDIVELTPKDYLAFRLPPISELFEKAKDGPVPKFYEKRRQADESELTTQKRKWLNNIKIVGGYQYGVIDNNATFSDNNTPIFSQYSGRKQNWYNVGLSLSIPLDEIFDRKNRIKKQELTMQASEFEKEKWYDEQKLRIVEVYTIAVKQLALIKIRSEALLLSETEFEMSKNDFINGKITVQELNRQKSSYTTVVTEYEEMRAQLNNALLQLEILAKTNIISK